MLKQQIESLMSDLSQVLPDDLKQAKEEVEENVRATLTASLAKLDLVTREEFDIQTTLLQRSRARLEELQTRIETLEKQVKQQD